MRLLHSLLFFLLGVILVAFALSNRDPVAVQLFPLAYQLELPLFLVFFFGFLLGFLVMWCSAVFSRLHHWRHDHAQQRELKRTKKALAALQPPQKDAN